MSRVQSTYSTELAAISLQLDLLVIKYFETFANLLNRKQQLECAMKDGYLYMAKARYSMGVQSVSRLQYNEGDMDLALVHVGVTSESGLAASTLHFVPESFSSVQKSNSSLESELTSAMTGLDIGTSLRRRNVDNDSVVKDCDNGAGNDKNGGVEDITKESERKKTDTHDPLRWFGVLVPPTLRQCQKSFRSCIELACDVATLQSELLDMCKRYAQLMNEKRLLVDTSSNVGVDAVKSS